MPARGRPRANSHDELLEPAPRCIRVCAIRAGALLLVLTSILAAVLLSVGAAAPGTSGATGAAPPAASPVDLARSSSAGWGRPWACSSPGSPRQSNKTAKMRGGDILTDRLTLSDSGIWHQFSAVYVVQ